MNKNEITKEWGKLEKTIYEDSDFSIEITEIYKDKNGIERRYITTRDKNIKNFDKYKEVLNRLKVVYTSMQFSAPENMYIFIEQMGDLLEEIE